MNRRVRLGFVLLGCAACSTTEPGAPPVPLTALPRELTTGEQQVSRAANQFTLSLFQQLSAAQPDSNVFVSPLSVSFSVGMAMNGANGTTFDEMRSTLGFSGQELPQINEGYRGLMSLEQGLDPSATFQIANAVWYKQGFTVNRSFIDMVKQTFDAEIAASPFDQTTITQVNDWVRAHTNGKIEKILDSIDPLDRMFLVNAIYFKGSWRDRFDPAKTRDESFTTIDGATQTVKLMHRDEGEGRFRAGGNPDTRVAELTYGNGAFVMTVLLPRQKTVNEVAGTLDTARWNALVGATRDSATAPLGLPKLRLEYARKLNDDLKALGMRTPFVERGADFTRMSPIGKELYIAFVKHKTYVNVDEEGTEAAAITSTGIRTTSVPACFCVDRPFIFAIRERFSGTILFIGKIVRIPS